MNPTLATAHEAGRRARAAGWSATDNPHDDWLLGVAWAAGWHGIEPTPHCSARSALEAQTAALVEGQRTPAWKLARQTGNSTLQVRRFLAGQKVREPEKLARDLGEVLGL